MNIEQEMKDSWRQCQQLAAGLPKNTQRLMFLSFMAGAVQATTLLKACKISGRYQQVKGALDALYETGAE